MELLLLLKMDLLTVLLVVVVDLIECGVVDYGAAVVVVVVDNDDDPRI